MATIEITCPHCDVRTYVTFVRQTGNGSCPECHNEITDVFQYASGKQSGSGSFLNAGDFNDSGATIIASPSGSGKPATAPLELSLGDFEGASPASLPALNPASAPMIIPSESAPMLVPSQSAPSLMPSQSAPSLMPSNSAPTLMPSGMSAPANEGTLLTPPPPRLRQFSDEDRAAAKSFNRHAGEDTLTLGSDVRPVGTKRSTATLVRQRAEPATFAERPENDAPTRPTLPPVPVSKPVRKSTAPLPSTRRPTAPIPPSAPKPTASLNKASAGGKAAAPAPAKPPVRRPTASIPSAPAPASSVVGASPTRRPTGTLPAAKPAATASPPRRPTASIAKPLVQADEIGPEELSLLTPPPASKVAARPPAPRRPTAPLNRPPEPASGRDPLTANTRAAPGPAPATRAIPPVRRPTASLEKSPAAASGGKSYPPIRAPGAPPKQSLSVVNLGEAPRLAPPSKPKDFGKQKYDANLTRLGYTLPGSDVSHFDLPAPSPIPFGIGPDAGSNDEEPPAPRPPSMAATSGATAASPTEDMYEEVGEGESADEVDVPASVVSKANIEAGWADEGPNSGVLGKIDLPSDDSLDEIPEAESEVDLPAGDEPEAAGEFSAQGKTRKLPTAKPAPAKPAAPRRAAKQSASDDEPVIRYRSRGRYDSEVFWTRVLVGTLYALCAAGTAGFAFLMYKVHVLKEPLF